MLDQETGRPRLRAVGRRALPRALPRPGARNAEVGAAPAAGQLRLEGVAEFRDEIDAVEAAARGVGAEYAEPTIAQVESDPARRAQHGRGRGGQGAASTRSGRGPQPPGAAEPGARGGARPAATTTPSVVLVWVIFTGVVILLSIVLRRAAACGAQVVLPLERSRRESARSRAATTSARSSADGAIEVVEPGGATSRRCAHGSSPSSPRCGRPRPTSSAPTPSSSSSPTSPRTTSRSRCARSPASASCCSSATAGSSTSAPTSTSTSPSTARGGCRT